MRGGRASTTAQITTLARAALSGSEDLLNDGYAEMLLRMPWRSVLPVLRTNVASWPWFRELLANVGGRTCFFDEQIAGSMRMNVGQFVILGAGYDSRALRFASPDAHFYELDNAATQQQKRKRLAMLGLHSTATFVGIDFLHDHLASCLIGAGYKPESPGFFLWEGIVEYLTEGAVRNSFRALRCIAAPGSTLTFDALQVTEMDRPQLLRHLGRIGVYLLGEPRRFRIDPDDLEALLDTEGWHLESTFNGQELYDRYLKGALRRPAFLHNYVVVARPT